LEEEKSMINEKIEAIKAAVSEQIAKSKDSRMFRISVSDIWAKKAN
jgi:hypothetical protein